LALEGRLPEARKLIEFAWTTIYNRHWGCLNYVFTQLIRKLDPLDSHHELTLILMDEFVNPQTKAGKRSYTNFQNVIGMFVAMEDEHLRRLWGTTRTRRVIRKLRGWLMMELQKYEEEKIKENGDLE